MRLWWFLEFKVVFCSILQLSRIRPRCRTLRERRVVAEKVVFHNSKICFGGASDAGPDAGGVANFGEQCGKSKSTNAAEESDI